MNKILKLALVPTVAFAFIGCQAPCIFCSVPDDVVKSTTGSIGNLRLVEKELVDPIKDEAQKKLWKGRMAAFIAEARSLDAYAKQDKEFSYDKALKEERSK